RTPASCSTGWRPAAATSACSPRSTTAAAAGSFATTPPGCRPCPPTRPPAPWPSRTGPARWRPSTPSAPASTRTRTRTAHEPSRPEEDDHDHRPSPHPAVPAELPALPPQLEGRLPGRHLPRRRRRPRGLLPPGGAGHRTGIGTLPALRRPARGRPAQPARLTPDRPLLHRLAEPLDVRGRGLAAGPQDVANEQVVDEGAEHPADHRAGGWPPPGAVDTG